MDKIDTPIPATRQIATESITPQPLNMNEFKFRLQTPIPISKEVVNPELIPPKGLPATPPRPPEPPQIEGDSVTLRRSTTGVSSRDLVAAEDVINGDRSPTAEEAADVAAITRDQIRWEPQVAIAAQGNTSPANVLSVLQ